MQVAMEHNPYKGSLQVLIDGQARPRLSRYADKPFSAWYQNIFDLIDGEANEAYSLVVTAADTEYHIIRELAQDSKYCKNVRPEAFSETMAKETRIRLLESGWHGQEFVTIRICIMPSLTNRISMADVKQLISEKRFSNHLWDIRAEEVSCDNLSDNDESCEYLFIIAAGERELNQSVLTAAKRGYYSSICFLLTDGQNRIAKFGNYLAHHSDLGVWKEGLQELVYSIVVGDCFHRLYRELPEQLKDSVAFQIRELPRVIIPDFIELRKSKEVKVSVSSGTVPGLDISIRNPAILKREGNNLTGLSEGVTNVRVFESGTSQLLASGDVSVRLIPRIKELYPDDVRLRHGEPLVLDEKQSAVISFSYAPMDSENVREIRWSCDNPQVVRVHSLDGRITALHPGTCNVRCSAGSAGFSVAVHVRPRAEAIELNNVYGNEITLNVGEDFRLDIRVIPSDAHYGGIVVSSQNDSIVRVVDNSKLSALSGGVTSITIEENLHWIGTSFTVQVIEEVKEKKPFLARLFRK